MQGDHPDFVHHILLFCSQPLFSREFYRDVLGFQIARTDGEITQFQLGETQLMLYPIGGSKAWLADETSLGRGVQLYLHVPDVDAYCRKIKSAGVRIYNFDRNTVIDEPITRPWGVREFGVVDPDGYRLYCLSEIPA